VNAEPNDQPQRDTSKEEEMDPNTYLRHYLDFANARPGTNYVLFSMVTNQAAGGTEPNQQTPIASYAEGVLSSDGRGGISGRVRQYFGDRREPGSPPTPFDESRHDDLGVEITADGGTGVVTLVAHSWGGGRNTLTALHGQDGVLVATGASVGNQTDATLYAISLGQTVAPG
jgi:hypothetical protein